MVSTSAGKQEVRGSIPGPGMTDFCMLIFHLFLSFPALCITLFLYIYKNMEVQDQSAYRYISDICMQKAVSYQGLHSNFKKLKHVLKWIHDKQLWCPSIKGKYSNILANSVDPDQMLNQTSISPHHLPVIQLYLETQ